MDIKNANLDTINLIKHYEDVSIMLNNITLFNSQCFSSGIQKYIEEQKTR